MQTIAARTSATVPLHMIELRPQIRTRNGFDEDELRELADSIRAHGILQPIIVAPGPQPGHYELVAGERRILAATIAGLTEVPAVVMENATDRERRVAQAIENLQRKALHPLDIADGLATLAAEYPRRRDLAKTIGKSPAWISKHLALRRLRPEVRAAIDNGLGVSDTEAIYSLDQLARLAAHDARAGNLLATALRAAEEGRLSRVVAADLLRQAKAISSPPAAATDDDEADEPAADDAPADEATPKPRPPLKLNEPLAMWLIDTLPRLPAGLERDALAATLAEWAAR